MKNLLSHTSTTYVGLIVAGLMSIARMAGYELVEADVSNVVILVGLVFAFIGRAKAEGPMAWWTKLFGGSSDSQSGHAQGSFIQLLTLVALASFIAFFVMSAVSCGTQTARTSMYSAGHLYVDVVESYKAAYNEADSETRLYMRTEIAPDIDAVGEVIHSGLTMVILGQEIGPENASELNEVLIKLASAIADIALRHVEEVQ